jgi:DNA polymerase I-like protein with 3'-5' exonuclease and polymerase domains
MNELKSLRQTFLPDEGEVFVKSDLSQVEDRMGKMYCGSKRMVHLANLPPWEYDCHTENASAIFGEDITKLGKDDFKRKRYLGKKVVHASWRQMAGHKMSESVSKDTDGEVFIPPKECQRLIERYLEKNSEICEIYFPWCRAQVQNGGICFNSWGRRFDVRHLRIDADLYRKVFSFFPQSECADWTNQYAVIPAHYWMIAKYGKPASMQIHDEIVVSVPFEGVYDFAVFIKQSVERTREIPAGSGRFLKVPTEVTVSDTLYGGVEFEQIPERGEFERKIKEGLGLCY